MWIERSIGSNAVTIALSPSLRGRGFIGESSQYEDEAVTKETTEGWV